MMFLYRIRLKKDQKGHIIDLKGLKRYEKRQKMVFFDLKCLLFSSIFKQQQLGGTPLPPLTENHTAQKPLAERGGTPAPPPP